MEKLTELKEQMELIRKKCHAFDGCEDGSFFACLDYNGYYRLQKEYEELIGDKNVQEQ